MQQVDEEVMRTYILNRTLLLLAAAGYTARLLLRCRCRLCASCLDCGYGWCSSLRKMLLRLGGNLCDKVGEGLGRRSLPMSSTSSSSFLICQPILEFLFTRHNLLWRVRKGEEGGDGVANIEPFCSLTITYPINE